MYALIDLVFIIIYGLVLWKLAKPAALWFWPTTRAKAKQHREDADHASQQRLATATRLAAKTGVDAREGESNGEAAKEVAKAEAAAGRPRRSCAAGCGGA